MEHKLKENTHGSGNIGNRNNDSHCEGKGKRTKARGGFSKGNKHPELHKVTSENLRGNNSDSSKGRGRDELSDGIRNDLVDHLIEGMPIENADDGDMGDGNNCRRENSYDPERSYDPEKSYDTVRSYDPQNSYDTEKSFLREDSHPEGASWSDDLSLLCRSFDSGSGEHSDEPPDDSVAEFIIKKKIYERNIAMIERQIQTNKLNKLTRAREALLEMIVLIKNRKLSLS
ncbi:hypothetical protein C922_00308 [Plasmodium inui San Antonio 1]|uniref:Uncharacterized protein n=1 Tax=Plasmodium inui San Antonio 1 TaxID=1237626 RepID=W7ACK3_9APIC|nr:hypothetical protein C922_00308 [Plasmodium inui San Antonio 1]EUD69445.1 hypothetical protein C922_00308 [Plasmodium inui San Antonio 1]